MSNPEIMWSKAFAWNATNKNTIQEERQPSQDVQDATLNDGFPLITMTPQEAGGIAPNGQDMNGALYAISSDMVHRQKGLRIQFDPAYAAKIGGYDQGCILASSDYTRDYISLIPNNLTDPNGSGTAGRWAIYSGAGSIASATASIAGIVKIVDSLSSTATDAALTANQGKVLGDRTQQATTDTLGIIKISTGVQALAGTDDLTALTPKKLRNALSANGNAPIFGVRAFCTFDGSGAPIILAEGNIQSITVSGLKFTATFKTPMPHANYAICGFAADVTNSNRSAVITMNPDMIASKTVNGFDFYARYSSNTSLNIASPLICFSIIC